MKISISGFLIAAALCLVFTVKNAGAEPDRIPFTLTCDFETGELFAWESYPYAQDIGYDPALLCQREPVHNKSRYAIARIVKPNDMIDLSEGFTRQIDLWTTTATRLKCAVPPRRSLTGRSIMLPTPGWIIGHLLPILKQIPCRWH